MTRGPAGRVAAMLALLRPVADEILVAVDDRAEPEVIAALDAVADRLVGYPYAEPVDRPLPWLHRQVSGEWLLTIDDDEIPSAALIEALPRLVAAEDVTHYWLPRRWLFPEAGRYLDQSPWRPDYQLRLVLNDPRLLRFPDETHWPITALGPARYLDLPLYHADCVLNSLEMRERKAQRYERLYPGKRIAGRPLNEAFYLPERLEAPRTAPLPEADLGLVRSVLEARDPEPGRPASPHNVAPRQEIERLWAGRELADSAYRAALEVIEPLDRMTAGEVRTLDVRVENRGDAVWPWGPESRPEIRLTYRWWSGDGSRVLSEGLRTPLPADLGPGESLLVPVALAAPGEAGRHRLAIDLVHEHVRWFDCEVSLDVQVAPRRRLAAFGLEEGDLPLLAERAPELEAVVLCRDPDGLRGRYAGETAPSAETYLLDGLPPTRAAALPFALRAVRLLWNTRRRRWSSLPGGADAFLEALAGAEVLLLKRRDGGPRRERWVERATERAAKTLGLRVELL